MGGRPFLVWFERVLFHLLSVGTDDDELDEDYCPSGSSKVQHSKKKEVSVQSDTFNEQCPVS